MYTTAGGGRKSAARPPNECTKRKKVLAEHPAASAKASSSSALGCDVADDMDLGLSDYVETDIGSSLPVANAIQNQGGT